LKARHDPFPQCRAFRRQVRRPGLIHHAHAERQIGAGTRRRRRFRRNRRGAQNPRQAQAEEPHVHPLIIGAFGRAVYQAVHQSSCGILRSGTDSLAVRPWRLRPFAPVADSPAMPADHPTFYEQLVALERAGTGFVLVTLVESLGSTPQDTGAKMLVTAAGLHAGTIGGGRVEAKALALAQEILAANGPDRGQPRFVNWTLKSDVGMTCGGAVKLYFEPHPAHEAAAWSIAIFGAGHVAQALLPVLIPLPCSLRVFDSRAEWTDRLPRARNLRVVTRADLPSAIDELPADAFVLCLTQGHTTDRPILHRALATRNFPFLGVIGSDAKAAVLRRELIADGIPPERAAEVHCPLGLDFGTNHPHEIALSIAAQLLTVRDRASPR